MRYVRRNVSRGTRRPRRKIVFARGSISYFNQTAGTVNSHAPLSEFETAFGAQLLGATIMRIRGTVTVRNRSSVTTGMSTFTYGFMSQSLGQTDYTSSHPNPDVVNTNDDKFASWMWWDGFGTLPALTTPVAGATMFERIQRDFDVRSKRVLRNLDDTLILASATSSGGSNHDIHFIYSIALALP